MNPAKIIAMMGSGLEPEAIALFARMATPPTDERKFVINRLIRGLKVAGIWSGLDCFYGLAAADTQASLLNWVSTSFNLTQSGGAVSFTADSGWSAASLSGFTSGYTPGSGHYAVNAHHLGCYVTSETGAQSAPLLGDQQHYLIPRVVGNTARGVDGATLSAAVANGLGQTLLSRTASNAVALYKNGASIATSSTGPSTPSTPMGLFSDDVGTNPSNSAQRLGFAHWGGALSAAQASVLADLLDTYMAGL